jgi:hypothetical protein
MSEPYRGAFSAATLAEQGMKRENVRCAGFAARNGLEKMAPWGLMLGETGAGDSCSVR